MHNRVRQAAIQGLPLAAAAAATWALGLVAILCEVFERSEALIGVARILFASATSSTLCLALVSTDRARWISRATYVLLYSLAVVRVGLYLWTPARPLEDFQFYLVACVLPLWLIRAVVSAR